MEKISPCGLEKELDSLRKQQNSIGLKRFFRELMTMRQDRKKQVVGDAIKAARKYAERDMTFQWMVDLYPEYPEDIGLFSPILLNLIYLKPGQAMFLPAAELHAYLDGVGIELMANSDNVLRGGLTPKNIDVPELLDILDFSSNERGLLNPEKGMNNERLYRCPAEEFILSEISLDEGAVFVGLKERSVEIMICTEGEARIIDLDRKEDLPLNKGTTIIIPASAGPYEINGRCTVYRAAVPL